MTPAALRALARVPGALLPWRTIGRLMDDPCEAHAVAEKLETAGITAGKVTLGLTCVMIPQAGRARGGSGYASSRQVRTHEAIQQWDG